MTDDSVRETGPQRTREAHRKETTIHIFLQHMTMLQTCERILEGDFHISLEEGIVLDGIPHNEDVALEHGRLMEILNGPAFSEIAGSWRAIHTIYELNARSSYREHEMVVGPYDGETDQVEPKIRIIYRTDMDRPGKLYVPRNWRRPTVEVVRLGRLR
jgi:hypothetical protein